MSKPMTHTQFTDLLKEWGLKTVENATGRNQGAWYNHNRNHKGKFDDVNGVMIHHTGSDNDEKAGRDVLWNGYAALPGPLCHAGILQNGAVLLNGWGRTNHAGLGDPAVLKHVINEDYSGVLKPRIAEADGNRHFYGFEIMYSGSHDMTEYQYRTIVRLSAAICTHHKWQPASCIGHGEWQPGKWDPGYKKGTMMNMATIRGHIIQAMREGPKPKLPTRPTPTTPTPKTYTLNVGDTIKLGGSTLKVTEVK